jgi:hypothetical protein
MHRAFDDGIRISSIYSTPLSRARETLEELRQTDLQQSEQRLPPTDLILDNLREIDFFYWEGKVKAELQAACPESWQAWEVGNPSELVVFDTARENSGGQPNTRYLHPSTSTKELKLRMGNSVGWLCLNKSPNTFSIFVAHRGSH